MAWPRTLASARRNSSAVAAADDHRLVAAAARGDHVERRPAHARHADDVGDHAEVEAGRGEIGDDGRVFGIDAAAAVGRAVGQAVGDEQDGAPVLGVGHRQIDPLEDGAAEGGVGGRAEAVRRLGVHAVFDGLRVAGEGAEVDGGLLVGVLIARGDRVGRAREEAQAEA
jgi:hypothetical protein